MGYSMDAPTRKSSLNTMEQRRIGPFAVSAIGLGCMNLSHAYGTPPPIPQAEALLLRALDLGITYFDTAALYGFGVNELLVGRVLRPHRSRITLSSKCGMTGVDGKRVIDGRPATIKATCDAALQRLQTDVIDLYYLHRWDKAVPIEDSVGALADLVRAGKVRTIGLSEVSAATLRRAHAVHPITAVQNEYSLWTREPEIGLLDECRRLGSAFVAFSPLGRGFLTGKMREPRFEPKDIRSAMPRFQEPHFTRNLALLGPLEALAEEAGCTPAQLALAWLLGRREYIIPTPGTTRVDHLEEDIAAVGVRLDPTIAQRLDAAINRNTVSGDRYNEAIQREIDTETFTAAQHGGVPA
jgi:hypothetical protein